mmetsp:Transcript_29819/g.98197  ORF Transcript_29819/g.98197 Transcript_29819/m.98197 type:complete len:335 (-) Transcript_29819:111-1115(-)
MHRRLSRGAEPLLDVRAAQVATQQRRVAARTAQQRQRDSLSADSRCSEQQVAAVIRDIVEQHAQKLRRPAAAAGAAAAIAIGAGVAPQGGGAPKARRVARQGSVAVLRTRRRLRARGSASAVRRWLVEERAEEGQDELARGLDVPCHAAELAVAVVGRGAEQDEADLRRRSQRVLLEGRAEQPRAGVEGAGHAHAERGGAARAPLQRRRRRQLGRHPSRCVRLGAVSRPRGIGVRAGGSARARHALLPARESGLAPVGGRRLVLRREVAAKEEDRLFARRRVRLARRAPVERRCRPPAAPRRRPQHVAPKREPRRRRPPTAAAQHRTAAAAARR